MATEQKIRKYIRQVLSETVNNFLENEEATTTKQLDDNSKGRVLGDPLTDIKMNQMANELGSDGKNAPTVAVTSGAQKVGSEPEVGQRQANFKDKTSMA